MFIETHEKYKILRYIQQEGCILIKEDKHEMHPDLAIKNLKVLSIATSLTAKGYLKRVFVWRHGYYTLTLEGAQRLRQDLCIDGDVIREEGEEEYTKEEDAEVCAE